MGFPHMMILHGKFKTVHCYEVRNENIFFVTEVRTCDLEFNGFFRLSSLCLARNLVCISSNENISLCLNRYYHEGGSYLPRYVLLKLNLHGCMLLTFDHIEQNDYHRGQQSHIKPYKLHRYKPDL